MKKFKNIKRNAISTDYHRGLTARMTLSFILLGLLYIVFLTFLSVYFHLGVVPLLFMAGFMIMIEWYFSDRIVLWSTHAKIVSKEQYPELHAIVENLVAKANLPKPRIAVINTDLPNAFATGKSPKSSVVAVTTGLMHILEKEELEAVIAHELTHVKNRDVMVITFASLISTIAWFMMNRLGGFTSKDDDRGQGALLILVPLIVWILSFLIIRTISRYRELAADKGGVYLTGKPLKLSSSLMKISGRIKTTPQSELSKVEGMNAFFIIPAVGEKVSNLFSTHPSLEARIKQLNEIEEGMHDSATDVVRIKAAVHQEINPSGDVCDGYCAKCGNELSWRDAHGSKCGSEISSVISFDQGKEISNEIYSLKRRKINRTVSFGIVVTLNMIMVLALISYFSNKDIMLLGYLILIDIMIILGSIVPYRRKRDNETKRSIGIGILAAFQTLLALALIFSIFYDADPVVYIGLGLVIVSRILYEELKDQYHWGRALKPSPSSAVRFAGTKNLGVTLRANDKILIKKEKNRKIVNWFARISEIFRSHPLTWKRIRALEELKTKKDVNT